MAGILAKALSALNITSATQKQQQQQQQQQIGKTVIRCPTIDTDDLTGTSDRAVVTCLHSGIMDASSSRSKREDALRMYSILDRYDCELQQNRWSVPRSQATTNDAVSDRPGGNANSAAVILSKGANRFPTISNTSKNGRNCISRIRKTQMEVRCVNKDAILCLATSIIFKKDHNCSSGCRNNNNGSMIGSSSRSRSDCRRYPQGCPLLAGNVNLLIHWT